MKGKLIKNTNVLIVNRGARGDSVFPARRTNFCVFYFYRLTVKRTKPRLNRTSVKGAKI